MANVSIEIRDTLTGKLDALAKAGQDATPAMAEIAGMMQGAILENFEGEHDPQGVPWQPSERKLREGGQTLQLSRDLMSSIIPAWGEDFAAAGPEASGGAAIYAAIHQWGGAIKAKVKRALKTPYGLFAQIIMPRRSYVGWNDRMGDEAETIITRFLRNAVAGG